MSHYNNSGGCNNLAYHDSDTLEIDRSPSRKSRSHHSNPHGNPYPRDDGAVGQRGRSDLQQLPGGGQSSYDEAQGRVPWGGWQEGSWRGRDSIPMGLLPPRSESPQWQQHDLNHSGYQIDQATHYDTTPPARLPSATSGHVSMRFRGSRRMSLFPVGEAALGNLGLSEDDIRNEMENEEQNLVKELVAMSTRDRIKAIRDLPMSFDDKKHIRGQVLAFKSFKKSRQLNCFADCSKTVSLSFRRCGANMTLARQTLELWRGTMKEVGGKFGTGVLSYFKFLKWLLMFNIFSFLVNFGFITIPQLIYDTKPDIPSRVSFKGLEILTGAGYFSDTVMYYGGYSNETQGTEGWSEYNMQLAYFFTIAAYMVLCGAALIYRSVSLTQNCQPPRRAGRAAQMQTIFIAILFFPSFVGALSMVAYTVWTLPPSKDCGPFRGLSTTFSAVQIWMDGLEGVAASQWTVWIYQHVIRSEIFYFLVSLITLVFIYVFRQITQGRKLLIILLRQQIVNEGKDKAFLLEKLQNLQKSKQNKPKKKKQVRKRQENESSTGMLQALLARQRAMMQVMQARQRAEEEESEFYRAPASSQHPDASGSGSALIQAMLARQQVEEEYGDRY
ncbi:hypothetical protein J4Q44_G00287050 [Coregonus suidteri]|uniref:Transmembrane channel-like protein n=1 Tax=Coregonus suidteri TaxID=861788 RepID=A0AAN8QT24_9TELE